MEEIFSTEDIFKQAQALGQNAANMNLSIGEAAAERAKARDRAKKEKEEKKAAEKAKVAESSLSAAALFSFTPSLGSSSLLQHTAADTRTRRWMPSKLRDGEPAR